MNGLCECLRQKGMEVLENEPMREHTTFRVGGPARLFVSAHSEEEIIDTLQEVKKRNVPLYLTGNGSNLLIADGGLEGVVLHIGSGMSQIHCEGERIQAQAGASLSRVAQLALEQELTGLEPLSGIPGSVGGAAVMNAGAYGGEMSQVVEKVEVITPQGEKAVLTLKEMEYGYRKSAALSRKMIVTNVHFLLKKGDKEEIAAKMRTLAAQRREKQPLSLPSAGSFFKRPQGYFAGALIEQAGLKGFRVGGAAVSELHAGFVVNLGSATATDIYDLMHRVQKTVMEKSGVALEPEVRLWGFGAEEIL